MKIITKIIAISVICLSCSVLFSCGQDGPLYLPQKHATQSASQEA